ncbi:hypothetical protein PJ255_001260 [Klebsiella aerogenes]|uniref:hypothetical protein n=1 Tax=Klebsiella TaxID=570 RepID=UPI0025C90A4B|nr:hypothetical protein [Klebsiella aerogenes]
MITANNIALLFDDTVPTQYLFSLAKNIPLPQRLSWLYIIANIRESRLLDEYENTLSKHNSQAKNKKFDKIYANTEQTLSLCGGTVDRSLLAKDIVDITHLIAQKIHWDDLQFLPEHPHYMRAEYLEATLQKVKSVEDVCLALNINCIDCRPDSATIEINQARVDIITDSDNYADLRLDDKQRSASIALNAADFTSLTPSEALELAHEIGHCRNHLSSPYPSGDFALPFWDTELPAFEEEWRLCTALDPHVSLQAWSLEAIKQSVFALFPLLAPENGIERAFRYALEHNPIYCNSAKTPEWLLEKTSLFVWTGVPYVQYFLSLAHLILRHSPKDEQLAKLLSRSYSRFTLRLPSAGIS